MYQVKFVDEAKKTVYGIQDEYSKEAKEYKNKGLALVEDAVLPKTYLVPFDKLTEIHMEVGRFNFAQNKSIGGDEYHTYVQDEFEKALALSNSLPNGIHVGSLFGVGAGDGTAWYVVTKVNKKTCKVEWRGFCLDRWTDHHFGWGGTFNIKDIERYVGRSRALSKV